MFVGSVYIISRLDGKTKFQMITLLSGRHVGGAQSFTNMAALYWALQFCAKRISKVWENAETSNLEKYLLYLSSVRLQFLDFIHCTVFDIIFRCVTVKTIYSLFSIFSCDVIIFQN